MTTYNDFLTTKEFKPVSSGFDPDLSGYTLKDFQGDIVRWACNRGKAAIFADTGLGKTYMQLSWAEQVTLKTQKPILVLAPLAVSEQTINEGAKFNIKVEKLKGDVFGPGIYIINYEQLKNIDCSQFVGVVLDESSILKGFDGKMRRMITDSFKNTPYRLSCTATPSPNDLMEFGTQAEFLGIMTHEEMLAMFFIHDGGDTSKWRLKGHGRDKFYEWLSTWSVVIRNPGDYGYNSTGYDLPPVVIHEHIIESGLTDGLLPWIAQSLTERNQARRHTVEARCKKAAEIANSIEGQCLIWCHLNDESAMLAQLTGGVDVMGSDSPEHKKLAVQWFLGENVSVLNGNKRKKLCLGNQNTPKIDAKNTRNHQKKEREENHNPETRKKTKHICASTTKTTSGNISAHLNSKQNTTENEEKNTHKIRNTEKSKKEKLKNTGNPTLKNDLHHDSKNTESHLKNTSECCMNNPTGALYADQKILDAQSKSGSMLITATQQEELEDCCVPTAINPLGNSKTQSNYLEEQSNTSQILISKPSIFGFGMNFQQCNHMIFTGLSDSFEQYYQAVRRCWRFGQTQQVHIHIVSADSEGAVVANIKKKEQQHNAIAKEMIANVKEFKAKQLGKAYQEKTAYQPTTAMELPSWI